MNSLDELREALVSGWGSLIDYNASEIRDGINADLDAFEAAHPGLVDRTVPCPHCGKPTVLNGDYTDRRLGYWRGVCPACAEATP